MKLMKVCVYLGAGTSVSPDLNLAIEKAKMVAKSEIADMIKGTMNKQSKQFITEVGKTQSKTVVTEVEKCHYQFYRKYSCSWV